MRVDEYMRMIWEGDNQHAEDIRQSTIPSRLIKFVWLDGIANDEKKFKTLENDEVWISHRRALNDPYEFKGMTLDRKKFESAGFSQDDIELYQTLFNMDEYGMACLSANTVDYLPMWAYYTNNYEGFCVEYDIVKKDCIHEVMYETNRIKVSSLVFQSRDAIAEAVRLGSHTPKADFFARLFLQNLFIKAESWKHEKEYRIVYPLNDGKGVNVPVKKLGMRTRRIIAGTNSSLKNTEELNLISNSLGLGDVYKCGLSENEYSIELLR
jgi:hypothetical protein